jgi:hypothetical protein
MRTLPLLLSASLPFSLLVLAGGAFAQATPAPQSDDPSISSVQVRAPARGLRIRDEQAQDIVGNYAMSNGWYLKVRPALRHIDATIDNDKRLRLFPVSRYTFASSDGNVTMEFKRGSAGEEMVMSYMPDPRLAQRVVISSSLAQR